MVKRIWKIIGITLFIMWGLVQCARNDIAVRDPVTGEFQSLLAHWFADDIQGFLENAFPSPTPGPTSIPTATPATPQERISAYFQELTVSLARLDRDVQRIESSRNDKGAVALVGTSIFLTYWTLENMPAPAKADTLRLNIEEDYTEAHAWLLGVLAPCGQLGHHAQFDEQNDAMITAILDAHTICKERVAHLKDMYPDFFVCPEGQPCR
jgi:hypothetical protein